MAITNSTDSRDSGGSVIPVLRHMKQIQFWQVNRWDEILISILQQLART